MSECSELDRLRAENVALRAKYAELAASRAAVCDELFAARERASCPCQLVKPCSDVCPCGNGYMSGDCSRCCRLGSKEQQLAAAKSLVLRLGVKEWLNEHEPRAAFLWQQHVMSNIEEVPDAE